MSVRIRRDAGDRCRVAEARPARPRLARRLRRMDVAKPLYRLGVSTIVEFRGTFRLVEADSDRLRHLSKGTWYCRCGELATVERDAPECDICSAGSDCGLDCTVSRLSCAK